MVAPPPPTNNSKGLETPQSNCTLFALIVPLRSLNLWLKVRKPTKLYKNQSVFLFHFLWQEQSKNEIFVEVVLKNVTQSEKRDHFADDLEIELTLWGETR